MKVDETQVSQTPEAHTAKTLNRLKGSRVAIESFLERYADSQSTRIEALAGVEWLDRIVGEAAMGNFDSAEIDRWMNSHRDLAESSNLSEQDRRRISSLLLELQSSSDRSSETKVATSSETDSAIELRKRFATWKERSGAASISEGKEQIVSESVKPDVKLSRMETPKTAPVEQVSPRRVVLRRRGENADIGLFEKFTEQVWAELDLLYREFETGEHALTKLDEILKYAEAKTDPMYLHLAGSLIYFLKIEGFRMAPYAERLRKAEKRFTSGSAKS